MSIVPDPERPEHLAIDGDGNLLSGVFVRRINTPEAPAIDDLRGPGWEHVGWSKGIETHESPPHPEG